MRKMSLSDIPGGTKLAATLTEIKVRTTFEIQEKEEEHEEELETMEDIDNLKELRLKILEFYKVPSSFSLSMKSEKAKLDYKKKGKGNFQKFLLEKESTNYK